LGQEKLFLEYLEEELRINPDGYDAEDLREMIKTRKGWLNGQLAEWATVVDVGSWSGLSTRDMAKEVG
jgi:predicted metal-dependent hydrolase